MKCLTLVPLPLSVSSTPEVKQDSSWPPHKRGSTCLPIPSSPEAGNMIKNYLFEHSHTCSFFQPKPQVQLEKTERESSSSSSLYFQPESSKNLPAILNQPCCFEIHIENQREKKKSLFHSCPYSSVLLMHIPYTPHDRTKFMKYEKEILLYFERIGCWKTSALNWTTRTRDPHECKLNQRAVFLHSDVTWSICSRVRDQIKSKVSGKKKAKTPKLQKIKNDGPVGLNKGLGNLRSAY